MPYSIRRFRLNESFEGLEDILNELRDDDVEISIEDKWTLSLDNDAAVLDIKPLFFDSYICKYVSIKICGARWMSLNSESYVGDKIEIGHFMAIGNTLNRLSTVFGTDKFRLWTHTVNDETGMFARILLDTGEKIPGIDLDGDETKKAREFLKKMRRDFNFIEYTGQFSHGAKITTNDVKVFDKWTSYLDENADDIIDIGNDTFPMWSLSFDNLHFRINAHTTKGNSLIIYLWDDETGKPSDQMRLIYHHWFI